jgi:hypothetical protein
MNIRYYIDPAIGLPHIYKHEVDENEVEDILSRPGEDKRGRDNSRVATGQTQAGRYLCVIYVLDALSNSIFVITAYDLRGKTLAAYRRRRQKKTGRRK